MFSAPRIYSHRLSISFIAVVNWSPLVAMSLVIFWFSSKPGFGQPHLFQRMFLALAGEYGWATGVYNMVLRFDAVASDIAHFVIYSLLALTSIWAVKRQWPTFRRAYTLAFVYPAYFAITDEVHQYFVPGRHCDWHDVATDWTGAAFTLIVAYSVARILPVAMRNQAGKVLR